MHTGNRRFRPAGTHIHWLPPALLPVGRARDIDGSPAVSALPNAFQMPSPATPQAIAETALSTLKASLRGHVKCALLDFPDHGNVGDSAIWSGEIAALEALGVEVVYVATYMSFSADVLRARMPEGVILIHGGGNFGTVWPECQAHREDVLSRFKDYAIVQLPQSIHYADAESLARTRSVIAAHPDFTMLVRDEPSRALATMELGARTVLCTDSAFFLHERLTREPPVVEILALARTDKERVGLDLNSLLSSSGCTFEIADWLEEPMTAGRRIAGLLWPRSMGRLTRIPGFFGLLKSAWDAAAWARIQRGCKLLSRGRVVITDRLHAHILCTMLGIPHVVLDNHYGKVQNFIASWTLGNPLVHRAATPEAAVAQAAALLKAGAR
jgi:pyruvyl transferase EpsO